MRKHIAKFEAVDPKLFAPNVVLKEFNLTTRDLDEMIHDLHEYEVDVDLYRELSLSKERAYRDLRKWKIQNFITRYKKSRLIIDEAILVEDYMLELMDQGFKVKVDANRGWVYIHIPLIATTEMKHLSIIEKLNLVTSHLLHESRRMTTLFQGIEYHAHQEILLKVSYQLIGSEIIRTETKSDNSKIEDVIRRITDPNTFAQVDLRHQIFPPNDEEPDFDEDDEDEADDEDDEQLRGRYQ